MADYTPRPDIFEHLSTTKDGSSLPEVLFIKKPVWDENGMMVTKGDEVVVDLHSLFTELGMVGVDIPMQTFLETCEHILQMHEEDECK